MAILWEKNKEIRDRAVSDKKQKAPQNPEITKEQNFLDGFIKDMSSLKRELLQSKKHIESSSDKKIASSLDKKLDILSDHVQESSELQAVISEMDKQYQEKPSSTINQKFSVSSQIVEDLNQESSSLLSIYQEYPSQISDLAQKFGNGSAVWLLRDMVSAWLDPKKPADRGRIESIFSLHNSLPHFIGKLLF
jgi:hypothetical protein